MTYYSFGSTQTRGTYTGSGIGITGITGSTGSCISTGIFPSPSQQVNFQMIHNFWLFWDRGKSMNQIVCSLELKIFFTTVRGPTVYDLIKFF